MGGAISHEGVVVSHDLRCGMSLRGNTQRHEPGRRRTPATNFQHLWLLLLEDEVSFETRGTQSFIPDSKR
jgi:hypothetical protein